MLKRLELVGFKSFADKTTFNFGDGVTAVVGPNGSGKSNIVDAVRWILGEQSAKSMRGGEMADVIFNGSASRRGFGMAEVTMIFDNRKKSLATDAEEVQITRRVYRSGEGEYLINQQICRLKDIKDLFLGSGAGLNAYCIIEQGKVDGLLQASTKERRTIFEEAAGISRFKAKKIETLRKLERTDQNLARVKDIVDEVDKQLRSVKLQASKAQRFQEHFERLRLLRCALGLQEFHQLSEQLQGGSEALQSLRAEAEEHRVRTATHEQAMRQLDARLAELDDSLRDEETSLGNIRQQIHSNETTLHHEDSLANDVAEDLQRNRTQLCELTMRLSGMEEALSRAQYDVLAVENEARDKRQVVRGFEEALQGTITRIKELQDQHEADKGEHLEQMRRSAHLQNEALVAHAQIDNLRRERTRLSAKTDQAAENLATLDVELQELIAADEGLQKKLGDTRRTLADQRSEGDRLRQERDLTQEQISTLRQERSGIASRIELLRNLIRSHEGLGAGVREVLSLLEGDERGPWSTVLGLLADFLTVRREYASLIDLALGDWAQRFVVRNVDELVQALAQREEPFSGRVSFLPIHPVGQAFQTGNGDELGYEVSLESERARNVNSLSRVTMLRQAGPALIAESISTHPGIIARADQVVSCEEDELAELPRQLLGNTLIVRDLPTAQSLAGDMPGVRLITLDGELLEADGTLTVGMFRTETGMLSRRSELHDLEYQIIAKDQHITEAEQALANLRERILAQETLVQEQQEAIDVLAEQAADLRSRLDRHREKRDGLHEEVTISRDEIGRIDAEIAALETSWQEMQRQAVQAEEQVRVLLERMHQAEREIREAEQRRQEEQQYCTTAHIALAKVEERLAAISLQHEQLETDVQLRRQEFQHNEKRVKTCKARLLEAQRIMLSASANLAAAYLEKESLEREVFDLVKDREQRRQARTALAAQSQTLRDEWQQRQEMAHGRELEVNDLRHRRDTLSDRLREDYQLELGELYQQWLEPLPVAEIVDASELETREADEPVREADEPVAAEPGTLLDQIRALLPLGSNLDAGQANEEIGELRKKLGRLGSVNMDSLGELAELEERATSLQAQLDDLLSAKKSLEEIITKINDDSRRLFTESFASIRLQFQELFRKLFGGGMADIVFEDENDILDSGIEIIARPPGKELRSISLMSGGEKTMTAVALLLAIFRSKPSPFCLLDEVDAALDEANIGRFTNVLREFLDLSQFIIVTHSKKTMSCADVIYGITMQESGISKQVAVRFEDWDDKKA